MSFKTNQLLYFYLLNLSGKVLKTGDSEEELEITPNNISYLITD